MIAQAHWQRDLSSDKPHELELLDRYLQNWNMPEKDFNLHYSLIYNFSGDKDKVKTLLHDLVVPDELTTLTFDQLGIVEIDFWGNPTRIIHTAKLRP